ncbi:MAG: hypothetical protein H7837_04870 [Magnetococcus sp. MYC-9]
MITLQTNDFQYQSASFVAAEQEAMSRLLGLHEQIVQAKSLLRYLKRSLCAPSCLEKSEAKLAQLQGEARQWHAIRLQATQSKRVLSHVREEMTLWRDMRRQAVQSNPMSLMDQETAESLCPLDGSSGCYIRNQFSLLNSQNPPCDRVPCDMASSHDPTGAAA